MIQDMPENIYETRAPICWDVIKEYFKGILSKMKLNEKFAHMLIGIGKVRHTIKNYLEMNKMMEK